MQTWYPRAKAVLKVLLEDWQGGATAVQAHTFEVVPRLLEVERNPPRQADTFSIELDYRDLPLDPRTVRGVLVGLYLGTVDDPGADLQLDDAESRVLLGTVDEPSSSLEESGESVRLTGRDFTSYFLDFPWPGPVELDRPFSAVVDEILQATPGAASGITVVFDGAEGSEVLSTRLGRKRWTPAKNDDAWTVLTSLCGLLGCLPVMELDQLRITTTEQLGRRQAVLLYGENLSSLRFSRKFKEARTGIVEVRCWDEANRELRSARFPPVQADKRKKVGANGKVAEQVEPMLYHHLRGSMSTVELQAIAQHLFEEHATMQVEGSLQTQDLVDADSATNLWQVAAGDSVLVTLGRWDPAAVSGMSDGEALAVLTAPPRGLDLTVAAALLGALRRANDLSTTFLVTKAGHKWTRDEGYSLNLDFQNYLGA